jgi:peroxiredoxin family protein
MDPTTPTTDPPRKIAIICSHAGLDEAYPALILAHGARQAGIDALVFFTFWGLDVITEKKVDHLHVNVAGNPASGVPTVVGGLPGMEAFAAHMMKRSMTELELPGVREMLQILEESGAELYGCELAMKMFKRTRQDLIAEVKDVITVGDFYDLSAGAQIIFT